MMTEMSRGSLRNYEDVAGRAHMDLTSRTASAIVIVEGSSDRGALSNIISRKRIFVAGSRNSVFETAEELRKLNDSKYLCVYDCDFVDHELAGNHPDHCHPYPTADLESFVLDLGCATAMIESMVSQSHNSPAKDYSGIVHRAKQELTNISKLRLLNAQNAWNFPFSEIGIKTVVQPDGSVDYEKYINIMCAKRRSRISTGAPAPEQVLHLVASVSDPGKYRGRDLLSILSQYLSKDGACPAKHGIGTSEGNLEVAVHTAARTYIEGTDWGNKLSDAFEKQSNAWINSNS
ncbi:hypothetical protein [Kocuria palustris]|uniref:hypothetical protein n=1 Tax=Kocuria palustris TaxID=71999 RepID=UPI0024696FD2|nr:hypothetical protein [Kocuria palustris]MDH5152731.1 hypothetical protein [Kocuria palustris]